MEKFLGSNETKYRLLRTILQGVIGVLIANIDLLFSGLNFSPEVKAFIVALVMAILSPIMSELGVSVNAGDEEQDAFNDDDFLDLIDYEGDEDESEIDTAEE